MNHLTWSKTEKAVAKTAFETAYRKECEATIEKLKERVASAKEPADLWRVQDFLKKRLFEIEQRYDYRYSVIIFVFAALVRDGWLQESDLKGLSADKLEKINYLANLERLQERP
jgi:hypothetical protein